jgi:hypothetical protein
LPGARRRAGEQHVTIARAKIPSRFFDVSQFTLSISAISLLN